MAQQKKQSKKNVQVRATAELFAAILEARNSGRFGLPNQTRVTHIAERALRSWLKAEGFPAADDPPGV